MSALLSFLELLIIAILGGQCLYVWLMAQADRVTVEAAVVPAPRVRRALGEPRGP